MHECKWVLNQNNWLNVFYKERMSEYQARLDEELFKHFCFAVKKGLIALSKRSLQKVCGNTAKRIAKAHYFKRRYEQLVFGSHANEDACMW